jgi:hypothetical protein
MILEILKFLLQFENYLKILSITLLYVVLTVLVNKEYKIKPNDDDLLFKYKINHFFLNWVCIYFYIGLYIYLFTKIRSHILTKEIDLGLFFKDLKNLCQDTEVYSLILFLSLLILIIYIFMLLFIKLNKFFIKQLAKRYVFLFCNSQDYISEKVLMNFLDKLTFNYFVHFYIYNYTNIIDNIINNKLKKNLLLCQKLTEYFVYKFPFYFILVYFFYECYFNNFVLSITFNTYFYIFAIYSIYKRLSNFQVNRNYFVCSMLYDMYYCGSSILYFDIPEYYQDVIFDCIRNGLFLDKNSTDLVLSGGALIIETHHKFVFVEGIGFCNCNNEILQQKSCEDPYVFTKNLENFC